MPELDATLSATDDQRVAPQDSTGSKLGRYVKLAELGRGAMGVVVLAYDPRLDRKVAIKLLRPGVSTETMLEEARALARVSHPNVVTVHDADHFDEQAFICMEFVEGQTLRAWQRARRRPLVDVLEQYRRVAHGLAAVHAAGLVHRDIKPENVMVSEDGRTLVMDFGVAGMSADPPTAPERSEQDEDDDAASFPMVGTPTYMAPEEFEGLGSSPESDQFSFCVALYEALTRTRPFEGTNVWELSINVSQGRRAPLPSGHGVPRSLLAVLDRGLSVDPTARFSSMQALVAAIDRATRRWPQRLGIAGAVLTTAVGVAVLARPDSPCEVERAQLEASWSPAVRSTMRSGFEASGHPEADEIANAFEERIDAFAADWQQQNASLCEATRSQALLPPQRNCLTTQRDQLDTLTEALDAPDRSTTALALQAASSLPKPSWCTGAKPEIDVSSIYADAFLPVERKLAATRALSSLGKLDDAQASAEDALRIAEASHLVPACARAKQALFAIAQNNGVYDEAEHWLVLALRDAAAADDDELLAKLWTSRVRLTLESKRNTEVATAWLEVAQVAVARIGSPPRHRVDLLNAEGQLLDTLGKSEDALALFEQADELARHGGLSATSISSLVNNQATMLAKLGRAEESRPLFLQAASLAAEDLGAGNRQLVTYRNNAANACMQLRDWACALREFEEIERVLDGLGDTASPTRARMHGGVSQAAYFHEDYPRARTHAQAALRIYDERGLQDHPRTAAPVTTLARVGLKLEQFDDTLTWAERLGALDAKLRPPGSTGLSEAVTLRARALMGLGRNTEALAIIESERKAQESADEGRNIADLLLVEAKVLAKLRRHAEAEAAAERSIRLLSGPEFAAERREAEAWLKELRASKPEHPPTEG